MQLTPTPIPARLLVHQEGVLATLALVGLSFRSGGPLPALLPTSGALVSIGAGSAIGLALSVLVYFLRSVPAVRALESWQRVLVKDWQLSDALAVAVISGLAEEALLRALLQPLIGLVPAAAVFAALHFIPDRRLWLWPIMALAAGVAFGVLFDMYGYPAAASAHMAVNGFSLARLRLKADGTGPVS